MNTTCVRPHSFHFRGTIAVLIVSFVLRVWLAMGGGQWLWHDETRFRVSLVAARQLADGQPATALKGLFSSFDHIGFKVLGLPPALAVNAGAPIWVAAAFFGAFSVGSLWLIWRLALVTTQDESTAFWSVAVAACAASLFYYSRHLFPYDPAMFCGLAAMDVGWRKSGWKSAFQAGLLAGAGFLIYNGYWLFCGTGVAICLFWGPHREAVLRRGLAIVAGVTTAVAACLLAAYATGNDPVASAASFSQTVTQGDFSEGWSFPFEYFWHTEGLLLVAWGMALSYVVLASKETRARALPWIVGAALIYLGLAVGSALLHRFVEYARIVRCLTPLMSLITGAAIADVIRRCSFKPALRLGIGLGIIVLATQHVARPLTQWFPEPFFARARTLAWGAPESQRIVIQNAHGVRLRSHVDAPVRGERLWARPHPWDYAPFHFEGDLPAEREWFRQNNVTMTVSVVSPNELPATFPALPRPSGPIRIVLHLPDATGEWRHPLVVTGCGREADILSVWREAPRRFRFGHYQWGVRDTVSEPITLDETREHTLVVSLGSLQPAAADVLLGRWLFVSVDGQRVFNQRGEFHRSRTVDVDIGRCLIGGGIPTAPTYAWPIREVRPLPPDDVLRAIRNGGS